MKKPRPSAPRPDPPQLQQALELHGRGNLDQAAALYVNVLAVQPDNYNALHMLGILRFQQGRCADAVEHIGAAVKLVSTDPMSWSNLGTALERLGRYEEALAAHDKALANKPDYPEALNNRGNVLVALKRPQQALSSYARALALRPGFAEVHFNQANALLGLRQPHSALAGYDRAVGLKPDYVEAWCNRGLALLDLDRPREALASYDKALGLRPEFVDAHINRGALLKTLERPAESLSSCDRALVLSPDSAEAHNNRGNALLDLKRYDEALASLDRSLALKPGNVDALRNRGNVLHEMDRLDDALASYAQALALEPGYAEAFYSRANTLKVMKRHAEALEGYDKAISLKSDYSEAYNNRGNTLLDLKRPEDALASFNRALSIKPDHPEALSNRANALIDLKRGEEALASCDQALALKPDHPETYNNRGNALYELRRNADALESYDRALLLKPDFPDVINNRGNALLELRRLDEAQASFRRALELQPDNYNATVRCMLVEDQMCLWGETTPSRQQLIARCREPAFDGPTFPLLAIIDDPALQRTAAEGYLRNKLPAAMAQLWRPRPARAKIRIGYLSADFNAHPVSALIAELFELHDRSRFEVYGISVGVDDGSAIRQRLQLAFDRWIDACGISDKALARQIRDAEIDIVIELGGHTKDGRMLALAERPAPVQATYLGYAATLGAPFIDYAIVDPYVVPAGEAGHFTEKLAWLPDCYMANDRKRAIAEATPSRAECGLPTEGFVFCCFNNSYKINPDVFDVWMRLLQAVPGSVLWLSGTNTWAQVNLRREAQARGVEPARLVFAGHVASNPEHLARQRLADLFLDTRPYNAHTTASDALWVGLPVLTWPGRSYAARVAGSLLHAIGLPELVTGSMAEYEALALRLATNPGELRALRVRLARNKATHPLFDADRFRRHIEAAYTEMWRIHRAGEAPRSFALPAEPR